MSLLASRRDRADRDRADRDRADHDRAAPATRSGLLRSIRLFRLFLAEQTDPDAFYASLASDAVDQLAPHIDLAGRTVVDVGGGGGWFTTAFRARGAHCYLFEPDAGELRSGALRSGAPAGAAAARLCSSAGSGSKR